MEGEDFDELIDNLPLHLRNKVLDHIGDEDVDVLNGHEQSTPKAEWARRRQNYRDNTTATQRAIWLALLPVVYTWAAVVGIIGIVCLLVPPLGISILTFAGYPGACHIAWRVKRSQLGHNQK